jgi:hypothetical protein
MQVSANVFIPYISPAISHITLPEKWESRILLENFDRVVSFRVITQILPLRKSTHGGKSPNFSRRHKSLQMERSMEYARSSCCLSRERG